MTSVFACVALVVALMGLGLWVGWEVPHTKVRIRGIWLAYNHVVTNPLDMTDMVNLHEEVLKAEKVAFNSSAASDKAMRELFSIQLDGVFAEGNRFTPLGQLLIKTRIGYWLNRRLRFAKQWAKLPKHSLLPPTAPVFLIGLPRTGSTMLNRLMAADAGFRSPLYWEMTHDEEDVGPCHDDDCFNDPRVRSAEREFTKAFLLTPNFLAEWHKYHETSATAVEEVMFFLERYMWVNYHALLAPSAVTRLYAWLSDPSVDKRAPIVHMRAWLSLQQSSAASPSEVRWLLKAPVLTTFAPELADTFPDSHLVFTWRDPKQIVPSEAGLWAVTLACAYDYGRLGLEPLGSAALNRSLIRAEHQKAFLEKYPGRALQLNYHEVIKNPLAAMGQIYAYANLTLSEDIKNAMKQHLGKNVQHKHGKPNYTLQQFGLTRDGIDARFQEYWGLRELCARA